MWGFGDKRRHGGTDVEVRQSHGICWRRGLLTEEVRQGNDAASVESEQRPGELRRREARTGTGSSGSRVVEWIGEAEVSGG